MNLLQTGVLIGIVGPCGSGKSTLVERLKQNGIPARQISQEHSYVPNMWQRLTHPDFLIFLDASFNVATQRRSLTWSLQEYQEQQHRLGHAREHADLYILTDLLSPVAVAVQVMDFLETSLLTK
jgi:deoxyadenosine/deoxycytidine kinase